MAPQPKAFPEANGISASYELHCHCGAVRYTFTTSPPLYKDQAEGKEQCPVVECKCSHCERTGAVLAHPLTKDVKFAQGWENVVEYRCGAKKNPHLNCKLCGCYLGTDGTVYMEEIGQESRMAINLRMLKGLEFNREKLVVYESSKWRDMPPKSDVTGDVVSFIPLKWTYNLPSSTFNRPSIGNPWLNSTTDEREDVTSALRASANATLVAYDEEFYSIFGHNPKMEVLFEQSHVIAHDNAIWVWDREEVWFNGASDLGPVHYNILDLKSGDCRIANTTPPLVNPAGGCYFDGTVYAAASGNETYQTSVVSVSVPDLTVKTEVNSFFGLRFSAIEFVTMLRKGNSDFLYFSAGNFQEFNKVYFPNGSISHTAPAQLPNAVWMFDPQKNVLKPVISRGQVKIPTNVKTNKEGTMFYASDFGNPYIKGNGPGQDSWSNPAIWSYTIADDGSLHDPQMFSMSAAAATYESTFLPFTSVWSFADVRGGSSDGLHVDDAGRVWTAEIDGIWVRHASGKVLGWVNGSSLIGNGNDLLGNHRICFGR